MTNPLLVVRRLTDQQGRPLGRNCTSWCPGCDSAHMFRIVNDDGTPPADGHHTWQWDGDLTAPTFEPEAFCLMIYESDDGTESETIWNSRDGVTPFVVTLRSGSPDLVTAEQYAEDSTSE